MASRLEVFIYCASCRFGYTFLTSSLRLCSALFSFATLFPTPIERSPHAGTPWIPTCPLRSASREVGTGQSVSSHHRARHRQPLPIAKLDDLALQMLNTAITAHPPAPTTLVAPRPVRGEVALGVPLGRDLTDGPKASPTEGPPPVSVALSRVASREIPPPTSFDPALQHPLLLASRLKQHSKEITNRTTWPLIQQLRILELWKVLEQILRR